VIGTSAFKSDEEGANGKNVLKTNVGLGFVGNIDWLFGPVSLGLGAGWSSRAAKTQYNFETNTADNLDANISQFFLDAGLRLRIINAQRFKWYVGGGYTVGSMAISYDEEKYKDITGTKDGLEKAETKGYSGLFLETGFEYIMSNTSGLRFSAKHQSFESNEYRTLGNKSVTSDYAIFGIQYMHYVNWDFFWK
jgi:hypothetical protein